MFRPILAFKLWRWRREQAKPVSMPDVDPEILRLGDELVRTKMKLLEEQRETQALRERITYLQNRYVDAREAAAAKGVSV